MSGGMGGWGVPGIGSERTVTESELLWGSDQARNAALWRSVVVSGAARAQLQQFDAYLAQQRWDAAVDTLRRLLDERGDELTEVGTSAQGFSRYVPLRDHLHQRLCELPEVDRPALAHYRQRVDAIAESLYRRGNEKQLGTGETTQGARNKEMDFRAPCTLHLEPARSTDQCRVNTDEIS